MNWKTINLTDKEDLKSKNLLKRNQKQEIVALLEKKSRSLTYIFVYFSDN